MATLLACSNESPAELSLSNFEAGVATSARQHSPENGDGFIFLRTATGVLQGLVDGLGHGPEAHRAAETALRHIRANCSEALPELFRGVELACRRTRGVVMALAHFDLSGHVLTLASIGNIELRMQGGGKPFQPVRLRGIVGAHSPAPVVTRHLWTPQSLLVMHTDGVDPHWHWCDLTPASLTPHALASQLLARFGRSQDDATVIVTRGIPQ